MVTGLCVTLGFVSKEQDKKVCKSLEISIKDDGENYFVDRNDIKNLLRDKGNTIIDQPYSEINVYELERAVRNHVAIENAEVFSSINGDVKIEITQRKPIIRIFNNTGESYYIDETGTLMPLSDNFTASVLVASGNIFEPYAFRYQYSVEEMRSDTGLKARTLLDELYDIAKFVKADNFWNAQVDQIFVNSEKEFEIIPRIGDHRILFGEGNDIEEKFNKLKTFYLQGLNKTNRWNSYSAINLKFKNQIVCTKK